MLITKSVLTALGASDANADRHLGPLNEAMSRHGINTPLRISHFLAQIVHESAHLKAVAENLNYSAKGLLVTFPKYFKSRAQAESYARQPERIANRVYGGRMGNGDEASGDGYRFRGRGLLQLTGKNNYRAFEDWLDVDLLAQPDLVADRFAAHSAVFFWDTNKLNTLADTDNLKEITKRVNGGLNGYPDRLQLLGKAKKALRDLPADRREVSPTPTPPQAPLFTPSHRVSSSSLNFRRSPAKTSTNLIAALPQGTHVEKVGATDAQGWASIRVPRSGILRDGFVAATYLSPLPPGAGVFSVAEEAMVHVPIPVALRPADRRQVTRALDGDRTFPLGEAGRPRRKATKPDSRAHELIEIIDWLDNENAAHRRYQPRGGTRFALTYVADYCALAGAYLPQVWWTCNALRSIAQGEPMEVEFDRTVRELSVNGLFDWFEDQGPSFGWQQEIEPINLQEAANLGEVCVIVAKSRDPNGSGHVVAVVPESKDIRAWRDKGGDVVRPVESGCGARNRRLGVPASAWWLGSRYRSYGLWRFGGEAL